MLLQSKSCQPLGRYFPELVEALRALPVKTFVTQWNRKAGLRSLGIEV